MDKQGNTPTAPPSSYSEAVDQGVHPSGPTHQSKCFYTCIIN